MMVRIPRRTLASAAVLLLAAACTQTPPPAPAPAVAPAPAAAAGLDLEPRCVAAHRAEGSVVVRHDCAGRDEVTRAVRFSVDLPAGWEFSEQAGRNVILTATRGWSVIVLHAGDQLPDPVTAADSASYWSTAAELMLERAPTPEETDALRREARDVAGARRVLTRAQLAPEALLRLAAQLTAEREGIRVVRHEPEVRTLAGGPAGYLFEVTDRAGREYTSAGYVTVRDGVFYGVVYTAREAEFEANRTRWEQAVASFVIHPRP